MGGGGSSGCPIRYRWTQGIYGSYISWSLIYQEKPEKCPSLGSFRQGVE